MDHSGSYTPSQAHDVSSSVQIGDDPIGTNSSTKEKWLLLSAIMAIFVWRTMLSACLNLIPDECSYWAWSRHLDWSYFDNSGMTAYLIRLSTEIFGRSTPFIVRIPFLVGSFITTLLVYFSATLISGSSRVGLYSAVFFNLTPVSLLGAGTAVHDNVLIMFWALALWSTAKFTRTGNCSYFYLTGVASGLAILSKYTGVLILPAILTWLVCSRQFRPVLGRKEPWIGAIIAVLFTLPIVWWNYQNDWASFKHILFIGSGHFGFWRRLSDGLGYQLSQLLTISPFFYLAIIAAIFSTTISQLRKRSDDRLLLLFMGTPLLLFSLMSFKGHAEANWAVMGYLSTGILAVWVLLNRDDPATIYISKRYGIDRFVRTGTITALLLVFVVTFHAWVGLVPAFVERRIGKADRIIWETRGWYGLGQYLPGLMKNDDVIAADSYQLCALLEFNIPGQPNVRYLAPWDRPTQFDVWNRSYDDLAGKDILFVSAKPLGPTSSVLMTIYENFSSVDQLPPYEVMYHGESIRQIYICRGHGFDPFKPRRLGPRSLFYSGQ